MTEARPFELVIDGETRFCVVYPSEAARAQALSGVSVQEIPAPAVVDDDERRPRGRPSFDLVLAAAVSALGPKLDPDLTLAERARRLLKHLAKTCSDPAEIPSTRKAESYLAGMPVRRKSRNKSRRKSGRVKIAVTGV